MPAVPVVRANINSGCVAIPGSIADQDLRGFAELAVPVARRAARSLPKANHIRDWPLGATRRAVPLQAPTGAPPYAN